MKKWIIYLGSILVSFGQQITWNPTFKDLPCSSDVLIDVAWPFPNDADLMLGVDGASPIKSDTIIPNSTSSQGKGADSLFGGKRSS